MKIGLLTSSRADFGIYLPLINKLEKESEFQLEIIAFGTHLSRHHGYTISEIQQNITSPIHKIESLLLSDTPSSIASAYGLTALKFADFWNSNHYDLVFALGDRFEMAAAVNAGIPHQIKFAHIHGGETTLGALDNIYRHQITLASAFHFTSTLEYSQKVEALTGSSDNVYPVGSLSLDGISDLIFMDKTDFRNKFQLPNERFALVTFHPETISEMTTEMLAEIWCNALKEIALNHINCVITMPNADTEGTLIRQKLFDLKAELPQRIWLIEHFGKAGYFAAMHYCDLMIGNTSSGIVESGSFSNYCLNVGDRQKGRLAGENVLQVPNQEDKIVTAAEIALAKGHFSGKNPYFQLGAADSIISTLRKFKNA